MKVYIKIDLKIINLLQKADLDEKKNKKISKPYIKMVKKIIKFYDNEIDKCKFHQYKRPILIDNIDVNKIVVSNKISFGKDDFKYFIGCKDS